MKPTVILGLVLSALFLAIPIYYIGFEIEQKDSIPIIIAFTLAFGGYLYLVRIAATQKYKLLFWLIGLGVLLRVLLVFAFPTISDDIYRFMWDGRLLHEGIHPLSWKPSELLAQGHLATNITALYPYLNSQEYYTVYPPLSQLVYYVSTIGADWSWGTSSMTMKLILLLAELGTAYFIYKILAHFSISKWWLLVYFLNPLLIVELTGQLHFEGLMVSFLAGSIYMLIQKKHILSGSLLAASVAVKLLPLMFVPVIANYLWKKKGLKGFSIGFVGVMAILFIPFIFTLDFSHFFASINLYFQKFEFNSSIYYLRRQLGYWLTGYNQIIIIGPLLTLISLWAILRISLKRDSPELRTVLKRMFYCFAIYLFLTTTVHPWYLTMLILLGVIENKWWPVVWSGVVVWSYTTYSHPDFEQNLFLISIEYLIVFAFIFWEYRRWISQRWFLKD